MRSKINEYTFVLKVQVESSINNATTGNHVGYLKVTYGKK